MTFLGVNSLFLSFDPLGSDGAAIAAMQSYSNEKKQHVSTEILGHVLSPQSTEMRTSTFPGGIHRVCEDNAITIENDKGCTLLQFLLPWIPIFSYSTRIPIRMDSVLEREKMGGL